MYLSSNQSRSIARACVLALTLALGACGDDEDDGDSGNGGTSGAGNGGTSGAGSGGTSGAGSGGTSGAGSGGTGGAGSGGTGGTGGSTGGTGGSTADAGAMLTDEQIGAVVIAANMGEVEQGEIAAMRAQNEEVVAFAEQMVEEHSAALERATGVLMDADIVAMTNEVSQELTEQALEGVEQLEEASDDEIDALYMTMQVAMHEQVLELIEDVLLPSADEEALQTELETMRMAVAGHLEEATELLEQVEGDAG